MSTATPPMLKDVVRRRASFEQIEDAIEQMSISEDDRAALWLWARFALPPAPSFCGHDRLRQRLFARGGLVLRSPRRSPRHRTARLTAR